MKVHPILILVSTMLAQGPGYAQPAPPARSSQVDAINALKVSLEKSLKMTENHLNYLRKKKLKLVIKVLTVNFVDLNLI